MVTAQTGTRPLATAADVDAAAARLAGIALRTPMISSPVLDAASGARVFLKAETLQRWLLA
jgi:threonine dehydratase